MNATTLEPGWRGAGIILSGLVVANFVAAKRWRYADNLATSEGMVRLAYDDREIRRRDRGWDGFFLGVFTVLSAVFTLAAIYQ